MAPDDPNDVSTRLAPRAEIETRIDLEFDKFSGFISEFSANLSEGGMFVKTATPKPVGTAVRFEFRLADKFKLIQGRGEVSWVRAETLSADQPAGMGIRFLELDPQSRELIATMVQNVVKEGGRPFRIEEEKAAETNLDADDLFAVPDNVTDPSIPVPAEEQESLDLSDDPEVAALFGDAEEMPEPPAQSQVIETTPPPIPAPTAAPIGDLLEPELPAPKPVKPVVKRRRKPIQIPAAIGIGVAVALGVGSAVFFRAKITHFLLTVTGTAPEREEFVATPPPPLPTSLPTAEPTAEPTVAPTAEPTVEPTVAPKTKSLPLPKPVPAVPPSFGSILQITWERSAEAFVLVLTADAPIPAENVTSARVAEGAPRELIMVTGVRSPFSQRALAVNMPEVLTIRTGYHEKPTGNELHIVADLGDHALRVTKLEPEGTKLRVYFAK